MSELFWWSLIGNALVFVGLAVAVLTFLSTHRHEAREITKEREALMRAQAIMHVENKERLEVLMGFHKEQKELNRTQREQTGMLREQTASLTSIAEGLDRRMRLVEDRSHKQ